MSRSSTFTTLKGSRRPGAMILSGVLAGLAAVGLAVPDRAFGQFGRRSGRREPPQHSRSRSSRRSPPRSFQRDANGRATIPIVLDDRVKDAKVVDAVVLMAAIGGRFGLHERRAGRSARGSSTASSSACRSAALTRSPVTRQDRATQTHRTRVGRAGLRRRPLGARRPVEHGGRGRPDRRHAAASDQVMLLGMDGKWAQAEEPLHWLVDSPDPVHSGDPDDREPSGRPSSTRRGPRGPAWACRSPWRWSSRPASRSAWSPAPTAARAWSSGTRPRRARGATASTARCSARSSSPAARSRACSGTRARATRNGEAVEGLPQGLRRLHRRGPLRLRPARAAVLLRPDRPVRHRRRPQGLERRAGRPAAAPRARAQHGRRLGRSTWSSTTASTSAPRA